MSKTVVACFESLSGARAAVRGLTDGRTDSSSIGIVLADSGRARQLLEEGPGSPAEGASIGSVVGGTLFGLAAVAMTTAPFGVLAVGPFVALVGGATAGAGVGGLLGALVGLGIPEHEAVLRVDEIRNGGVLVTAPANDDAEAELLRRQLLDAGARESFTL